MLQKLKDEYLSEVDDALVTPFAHDCPKCPITNVCGPAAERIVPKAVLAGPANLSAFLSSVPTPSEASQLASTLRAAVNQALQDMKKE